MKAKVLVFYCNDGEGAKALAMSMRSPETGAFARDVAAADGSEDCDSIIFRDEVPRWAIDRIKKLYPDKFKDDATEAVFSSADAGLETVAPRRRGRPRRDA